MAGSQPKSTDTFPAAGARESEPCDLILRYGPSMSRNLVRPNCISVQCRRSLGVLAIRSACAGRSSLHGVLLRIWRGEAARWREIRAKLSRVSQYSFLLFGVGAPRFHFYWEAIWQSQR